MFDNRIIGVKNGIYDKHAVNKQQLDAVSNSKADKHNYQIIYLEMEVIL